MRALESNPIERFLAYSDQNRVQVCTTAGALVAAIAWIDWQLLPNASIGALYIAPVLLASGCLAGWQIVLLATACSILREMFHPLGWGSGTAERILFGFAGFSLAGFFVSELNHKRRQVTEHLQELGAQMRLRLEAEQQIRVLIETSPLAILTLDSSGRVLLANRSAQQLLGFDGQPLQGADIGSMLPILERLLRAQPSNPAIRTTVECKGQRRDGEVFLAHVWLSTYATEGGTRLAAAIWDASENLRDREGTGLDSMMATSRVLIGAVSHEIRNLAAAAVSAWEGLGALPGARVAEQYQALGSIIKGLEKIAASGLKLAAGRSAVAADLGTVLDEARIVIEPALRECGGSLIWQVAGDLPRVQADHHSLLQVFLNLARNSQRALETSERKELIVNAAAEADLVVVRFRDSGPGVAHPEDLFKPFQPGSHSAGLGLYISKAILRSHGGDLRYESGAPGGSFVVELWPVEEAKSDGA